MSYFNQEQIDGFLYGIYICSKCGHLMKFTDKFEDELYCESCGHTCRTDDYGCEEDEYDEDGNYILKDENSGDWLDELLEENEDNDEDDDNSEDYDGETYHEEADELSHDD